ncbi:MAG TPA: hypothetical protein VJ836_07665 [Candidatus Saccharimonadales bacterium]|nr:hypothetical protein [Candidatus Saccharimonadales bacterium]
MQMSAESYLDSIRPNLAQQESRNRRVEAVTAMLRHLISNHFEFDDDGGDEPLQTPPVNLNPADPGEIVWLRLTDKDDCEIPKTQAETVDDKSTLVDRAEFRVSSISSHNQLNTTAFTITSEPPDVLGHDSEPLSLAELDSVIVDLQRYGDTLAARQPEL